MKKIIATPDLPRELTFQEDLSTPLLELSLSHSDLHDPPNLRELFLEIFHGNSVDADAYIKAVESERDAIIHYIESEDGAKHLAHLSKKTKEAAIYAAATIMALFATFTLERELRHQQTHDCPDEGKDVFWQKYHSAKTYSEKADVLFGGFGRTVATSMIGKFMEFWIASSISDFVKRHLFLSESPERLRLEELPDPDDVAQPADLVEGATASMDLVGNFFGFGAFNLTRLLTLYPRMTVSTWHQLDRFPTYIDDAAEQSTMQIISKVLQNKGFLNGTQILYAGVLPGAARTVLLGSCYPMIKFGTDTWASHFGSALGSQLLGAVLVGATVGGTANLLVSHLDTLRIQGQANTCDKPEPVDEDKVTDPQSRGYAGDNCILILDSESMFESEPTPCSPFQYSNYVVAPPSHFGLLSRLPVAYLSEATNRVGVSRRTYIHPSLWGMPSLKLLRLPPPVSHSSVMLPPARPASANKTSRLAQTLSHPGVKRGFRAGKLAAAYGVVLTTVLVACSDLSSDTDA